VTTVPQHQAKQDSQVKLDPTVTTDHQAQPVHQAPTDQTATTETQDPKDHQAHQEALAKTANQETKAKPANQANRERKVSAPNTAPSMVVSSSKMVRVVKPCGQRPNPLGRVEFFVFNMTEHYCSHAGFSRAAILVLPIVTKKLFDVFFFSFSKTLTF